MKAKVVVLVGLLLLLPAIAGAGTTCATATMVPASGGSTDFDFVAPNTGAGTGQNFYQFGVSASRSYSVEVLQDYDDVNADVNISVNSDTGCSTLVTGLNDTTKSDPAVPKNAARVSFTTAASLPPNTLYNVVVTNSNASTGHYIRVSVAETTLFTPLYTTFSGFNTFYRVFNTTNQPITGTLTAYTPTGATAGTPVTVTVGPLSSSLTIYTGVNIPGADLGLTIAANNAGPATFVHNGPPGGIIIDGFSSNGTAVLPIKFVSTREIR